MKTLFKSRRPAVRVFSLALCLAMALSLVPMAMAAQAQPAVSKNLDKHSYSINWANTVKSYLFATKISSKGTHLDKQVFNAS